jgi:hypothetical protein
VPFSVATTSPEDTYTNSPLGAMPAQPRDPIGAASNRSMMRGSLVDEAAAGDGETADTATIAPAMITAIAAKAGRSMRDRNGKISWRFPFGPLTFSRCS